MKIAGKNILLGLGIIVGAGGLVYLSRLNRLKANLEIVTSMMIHKVNLSGLTLRVDVTMKNPTRGTIKVKYPFVKMLYKGSTFASSAVENKDFNVPSFGEIKLDPIFITLSFISLASTAPGLLKDYRTNGNISFEVDTITTLNNAIPYSKKDKVTL